MTSTVTYLGDLRTSATHLSSGKEIMTDAPKDNQGMGSNFSPTDLVATALASCMATLMGISARAHSVDITGATFAVTKIMAENPRRIAEIAVQVTMPEDKRYGEKQIQLLEHAARTCPVMYSLSEQCVKTISFQWP